mmetsp:Transcript_63789/g.119665  ORF Transcript_63789/g.119665 Transcript_63789/m.119665 type:complete len:205 (+) Transcript_63789:52-666(+)
MVRAIVIALCIASAAAFAPVRSATPVRTVAAAAEMSPSVPFVLKPKYYPSDMVGDVGFDPLGLSENFDMKWLREAEIKHGRTSMLACLGFVVQEFFQLPGEAYSNPAPIAAVAQVGPSVMLQIVFGMGFVEWGLNKGKMTTMDMFSDGREPGDLGFDPMGLMKPGDPDQYALKEITHGRLAMLAISGMIQQGLLTDAGLFGHSA